jgi:hypothetical protein
MAETDRPRKKKKRAKQDQSTRLMLIIGGVAAGVGLILLLTGVVLEGRAQTLLIVFGLLVILVGGFVCLAPLLTTLRGGPKKLYFLEDRIEVRRGKDNVLGRIPFSNVATALLAYVSSGDDPGHQGVCIMLYKPRDLDTWWPHGLNHYEYDLVIWDEFNVPMTQILRGVLEGVERHLERKTGRIRDPGI